MQRTESKSIQVHPADEQAMITVMQEFNWNFKSSQEIKLHSQEIAGVTSTSITTQLHSEHYIQLVFERLYDFPNRARLVQPEDEYFSLRYPSNDNIKFPVITAVIAMLLIGKIPVISVLIIAGMAFWVYSVVKKNKQSVATCVMSNQREQEILKEAVNLTA